MKQTILLFILFFTFGLSAQDLIVDPDPVTLEFNVADGDTKVDFYITNNTNRDTEVWWEFDRGESPDEWDFYLCDINLCYTPAITSCPCSKPNELFANTEYVYMMHCVPNGVAGTGVVNLRILEECEGQTSIIEIPITYVVNETTSTSFQDINNNISIYPNPASQQMNIKEDADVTDVVIYNLIGKKIKSLKHTPGRSHDISDLDRGIYLVRMLNKEQNILKVTRLTKR